MWRQKAGKRSVHAIIFWAQFVAGFLWGWHLQHNCRNSQSKTEHRPACILGTAPLPAVELSAIELSSITSDEFTKSFEILPDSDPVSMTISAAATGVPWYKSHVGDPLFFGGTVLGAWRLLQWAAWLLRLNSREGLNPLRGAKILYSLHSYANHAATLSSSFTRELLSTAKPIALRPLST